MSDTFSPGTTIHERYRVDSLIGQGGMGAVYRVADLVLPGRTCALKVVLTQVRAPEAPADTRALAARRQFLTEASTLARLDHPNLPKVSDYFTLDEHDCLVMDYVPGQDLQQRVQGARREGAFLPVPEILRWMDQLCDVLGYLHGQQPPIIHGDIKPANIKLTADGRIKLVDFGLVRPADPEDPRTLTGPGLRGYGSLAYAALEQYAGTVGSVGPWTDLYSLGATLYHLLTGQPPAGAHARFLDPAALVMPSQINHGVPEAVEQAVMAAMQPHPDDRPASVAEWRGLLPPPAPASPSAGASGWAAVWRQNRAYFALAGLLVAAAIGLTFLR